MVFMEDEQDFFEKQWQVHSQMCNNEVHGTKRVLGLLEFVCNISQHEMGCRDTQTRFCGKTAHI